MDETIEQKTVALIAGILGVGIVNLDTEMDDIKEWDSLRHVMIVKALESEFGVAFPEEDMFDLVSVRAFAEEIQKLKGQ